MSIHLIYISKYVAAEEPGPDPPPPSGPTPAEITYWHSTTGVAGQPPNYLVGGVVRLNMEFRVDGALTDPTTLTVYTKDPSGNILPFTWALSQVTRQAAGRFYYDLRPTVSSVHGFRILSTGAAAGAAEGEVTVQASAFSNVPQAGTGGTLATLMTGDGLRKAFSASSASPYDIGDAIWLWGEFRVGGALTDPTTTTLRVLKPDGSTSVYSKANGALSGGNAQSSLGRFFTSLQLDDDGDWYVRWEGTGAATAYAEYKFTVRSSAF